MNIQYNIYFLLYDCILAYFFEISMKKTWIIFDYFFVKILEMLKLALKEPAKARWFRDVQLFQLPPLPAVVSRLARQQQHCI